MNLNLRTKEITSRKLQLGVSYGVLGPNSDLVLGGADVNDLVVYNHQTKHSSAHYGKALRTIFAQTQGKIGEPCLTDRGDLLVSVGKTAWLIRSEFHDIDLQFIVGLPINLVVKLIRTNEQTAEIQITLPDHATLLEENAILGLKTFVGILFGLQPFGVKDNARTILITGIPVEDAYSYQMMFESFVSRAKEFQTKTLPAAQKQLSPRRPTTQFFSSQSNTNLQGAENTTTGRAGPSMSFGGSGDEK